MKVDDFKDTDMARLWLVFEWSTGRYSGKISYQNQPNEAFSWTLKSCEHGFHKIR